MALLSVEKQHDLCHDYREGFSGDGDKIVARAIDSMGGFSFVLAAAKALLEHDIVLTLIADHAPAGIEER